MKRLSTKNWIFVSCLLLGVLFVLLIVYNVSAPTKTKNGQVEVEQSLIELEDAVEATTKAHSFVLSKIPDSDLFLKFHLDGEGHGEHEEHTDEKMKLDALETFYAAISKEEISYLTSALTPESFEEIRGEEKDFNKREDNLTSYMNGLNGDGSLKGMNYKLELDRFDHPTNNGSIQLNYVDGTIKEIPFTFVSMGEGDHAMFQINLNEIVKIPED